MSWENYKSMPKRQPLSYRIKKGIFVGAMIFTALWLVFTAISRSFPLQISEFATRYSLWRAGVVAARSGVLEVYTHDGCAVKSAQGADCVCVALIHGLGDNAMTWKKILVAPTEGFTLPAKVVAVDLPGSGESPAPAQAGDYSVRKQAEWVHQALAPICPKWVVVGNSLGGWVASWLALEWKGGVSRLILADAVGAKQTTADAVKLMTEPTVESMKEFLSKIYYQSQELPDFVWVALVKKMKSSNVSQVVVAQTPADFLGDRLNELHVPTLILWGAADRLTPKEMSLDYQAGIKGSILREVPKCGHAPQRECPLAIIAAINDMMNFGAF